MSVILSKEIILPDTTDILPVGGKIFYIHSDNGASYKFYDSSMNELTTITVAGLANAKYYSRSGSPSADKFYVYDDTSHTTGGYTATSGFITNAQYSYYGITTGAAGTAIGSGKTNTQTVLSITDIYPCQGNAIFKYVKACRTSILNGCDDWYIGSNSEILALVDASSTLPYWLILSSTEKSSTETYAYSEGGMYPVSKNSGVTLYSVIMRSF